MEGRTGEDARGGVELEGDARAEERKIGGRSARGEEARAEERKCRVPRLGTP